jgi:hypothetical protein
VPEPGDPDAVSDREPLALVANFVDLADDLMTRHRGRTVRRDVALGEVQISSAHATRSNAHPDLAWTGIGHTTIAATERIRSDGSGGRDCPCAHHSRTIAHNDAQGQGSNGRDSGPIDPVCSQHVDAKLAP